MITKDIAICEFAYKAGSWKKARILKGILTIYDRIIFGINFSN